MKALKTIIGTAHVVVNVLGLIAAFALLGWRGKWGPRSLSERAVSRLN